MSGVPYITPKDKVLGREYRDRYPSCSGKYALSVPFMERFFQLAIESTPTGSAGFIGKITANTFLKREFGKRLIEEFLSGVDITAVLDTSLATIPGHGTPTVILFGRNRKPSAGFVRVALGITGDQGKSSNATGPGPYWTSLISQIDSPGSESHWLSVADWSRDQLSVHPWILSGGGASQLLERLGSFDTLSEVSASVGFSAICGLDPVFELGDSRAVESCIDPRYRWRSVGGDAVRDWQVDVGAMVFLPRDPANLSVAELERDAGWYRRIWPFRSLLAASERDAWWDWYSISVDRLSAQSLVTYAEVSTGNHFAAAGAQAVYRQTAPVVTLKKVEGIVELVLASCNCSTAAFWLRNTCHNKGGQGVNEGAKSEAWERFSQFNGKNVFRMPFAPSSDGADVARRMRDLVSRADIDDETVLRIALDQDDTSAAERSDDSAQLIAWAEELDWVMYEAYGLIDSESSLVATDPPPPIQFGQRAFEIDLARKIGSGDTETEWFARHDSSPDPATPEEWPDWYRDLVERRIEAINTPGELNLVERPEFKRRWQKRIGSKDPCGVAKRWLLDRLETDALWQQPKAISCARLADLAFAEPDALALIELWAEGDIDPVKAVANLTAEQSVPYLAPLRYKESGLATWAVWDRTWDFQRAEDAIDARSLLLDGDPNRLTSEQAASEKRRAVGDIPKPPAYKQGDFVKASYWKLRGKLDVPKERFISYPGLETADDPSPVIGWAGWNHDQRAQALASLIDERERVQGWSGEQLIPLLAGLRELLPWLRQWHAEVDPRFGTSSADDFEALYEAKLHEHGLTESDLTSWRPPAPTRGRQKKAKA